MEIKKLNNIIFIKNKKDDNYTKIPGNISFIKNWEILFDCTKCFINISLNQKGLIYYNSLSNKYIKNLEVLNRLGSLFELKIVQSVNNPLIYYYSLNNKYKGSANFGYFICPKCNAQYLIVYYEFIKDERSLEPNEIYVEKIFEVFLEFENFLLELE